MNGVTDLQTLLKSTEPILNPGAYVYIYRQSLGDIDISEIVMVFKEREGYTLIAPKTWADARAIPYPFVAAWITLNVHSSLEAIGFTAAFSKALADHGISCNVVAGYYHDHLFVDQGQAEKAMELLQHLG